MARRAAETLHAQGNTAGMFELEGDGGHYDGFFQINQASAAIRDFLSR
jgi:hypothetical protein